jgi:flagellar biosynthesis/type III secretory pathway protein FliH
MYIKQKSYHEGYNKGFDDGAKHVLSCMGETKLKEYSKGFEEGYKQGLKTMIPAKINNIPDVKEDETDRQK